MSSPRHLRAGARAAIAYQVLALPRHSNVLSDSRLPVERGQELLAHDSREQVFGDSTEVSLQLSLCVEADAGDVLE